MLKERAAAAGIPARRVSGHSSEPGTSAPASLVGVGPDRIAAQTRHTRISTFVEQYNRPLEAMQSPPAATSASDHRVGGCP